MSGFKSWVADIFTLFLQTIYNLLDRNVVVMGAGDSALVIRQDGDVESVISRLEDESAHAGRCWIVALNWGFSPEAGDGVFDALMERFNKRFR